MNEPWQGSIVQWVIWGVAVVVIMRWLARSRLAPRPETAKGRLYHPISTLAIGLACFGFFAGIAVISNVYSNRTTTWWTTAGFIAFALMAVPMVMDYFRGWHDISEEGIEFGRMFGQRGEMLWSDVRSIQYAPNMKYFRLESRNREVARISAMLIGLPEFAQLVLKHVPFRYIEPSAKELLNETAAGKLPSIWE